MAPEVELPELSESGEAVDGAKRFYLHPGRLLVSTEPAAVTTILGSCVSVCLWDESRGIGGMNHHLLPDGEGVRWTPFSGPKWGVAKVEPAELNTSWS